MARSRSSASGADGGEELVAVLGPGRYFGELGPLFGLQRSATARGVGPAVLTGHSARDFRDLVGSGRLAKAIGRPSFGERNDPAATQR
jgi:putative ABC transport system ATP-binding protein